jgi:hypothetical protein
MARLNMAKPRVRPAICSLVRIDQTCFGLRSGLAPISLPYSRVCDVRRVWSDLWGLASWCSSVAEVHHDVAIGSSGHQMNVSSSTYPRGVHFAVDRLVAG